MDRQKITQAVVAVIRDWPKLEEFLRSGDCDGHPQQLVDELVDAVLSSDVQASD